MTRNEPQPEDEASLPAWESATTEEPKTSFAPGMQRFLLDSLRSKAVLPVLATSILLSFSIGMTVGVIPEVITDRYARLYHGYGSAVDHDQQPLPPCWEYDTATMPEACVKGADDAQTGSAYMMLAQNLLTFFLNASVGSYSDVHGRRSPLLVSLVLNTLTPACLVAMELIEGMDPFWYYASNASTGAVNWPAIVFAMLSDDCPQEHRAGRFAMNLAGFYVGFALSPTLAVWTNHITASWWSLGLAAVMLVFSMIFLPETLPELANDSSSSSRAGEDAPEAGHSSQEQQQSSTMEYSGLSQVEEEANEEILPEQELASSKTSCWKASVTFLLSPLREMSILTRGVLPMVAVASFLQAAVYNTDVSLVLYYIEEHLNVREDDIASMFFVMGLLGVILQGIGLQPLVYCLGEKGVLVVSFVSGIVHNFLYGIATNKTEITVAMSLSQLTKLNYPILSSLASQQVGLDEQGRVQGALLALNALAGAVGPVSMNWIYTQTASSSHYFGPGTMFLLASFLYLVGTLIVAVIPSSIAAADGSTDRGDATNTSGTNETEVWEREDVNEPLLLQLGESSTI